MTFGSTFGRVFSPTFQSKSQAAEVASSWWLSGGIDAANCVAAYQPKGAASYAASKVNLANPGMYDATEGTAPDWDSTNGWKGNGTSQYLYVGVTPLSSWTIAIRFSNRGNRNEYYYSSGNINLQHVTVPNLRNYWGNASGISYFQGTTPNGTLITTVISANRYARLNDIAPKIDSGTDKIGNGSGDLFILSKNATTGFAQIYIQAFAVYNVNFTAAQVTALTTAMNAL